MSDVGILAMVVFGIGNVGATLFLPRLWRGQLRSAAITQYWWPYGDASWIRFVRTWPVMFAVGWLMVITTILLVLDTRIHVPLPLSLYRAVAIGFAVLILLAVAVFVFGRPRVLIPPWLRRTEPMR